MPSRPKFVSEVIEQARLEGGMAEADAVTRIVEWAEAHGLRPTATPNHPTKGIGYQPTVQGIAGWDPFPIGVYPKRRGLIVEIGHLQKRKPFDSKDLRNELRRRLAEAVPDVDWSLDRKSHYPDVPLAVLTEGDSLDRLLTLIDWVIARIKRLHGA
jgi:hypothetical protein